VDPLPQEVAAPAEHYARSAEAARLVLERATPIRVRLGLQERAPANLRRHLIRGVWRVTALIIADLGSFGIMRALLRAVRDRAFLGADVAAWLQALLPPRMLNGWQFATALLVGLIVMGTYGPGDRRRDPRRLFWAVALAAALPLWTAIWSRGLDTVLVEYALTVTLVWAGLLAERMTVDRIVGWVRPPAKDAASTLFVGPAKACREGMERPAFTSGVDYKPIGFVDVGVPTAVGAIGHIEDFELIVAATGAETVVVCGHLTDAQFGQVVDASLAAGCHVLSVPRAVGTAGVHPATVWRSGQPLVELTRPVLRGRELFIKRVVDVMGSVIGLLVAAPVLLAIAVAIRLTSRGPILFRQERVGFGGRPFRMLKFRTMKNGADAEKLTLAHLNHTGDPRLFKIPNDPRVTPLGARLRRWSLDELPQLWNVLVGDMSLVGPRPFFEVDLRHYDDRHFGRLGAKPGITGLWQVKGRSSVMDFEEVVRLDRDYIRGWSLWLDLEILALTVPAVLRRNGAY
jgi:exopolysaccharide biosynthesis polyprenyl glycosylphosphotransferase